MKFAINFHDGLTVSVPAYRMEGGGNLLEFFKRGVEQDLPVEAKDANGNLVSRKFSDVKSFEFLLHEE